MKEKTMGILLSAPVIQQSKNCIFPDPTKNLLCVIVMAILSVGCGTTTTAKKWDITHVGDIRNGVQDRAQITAWFGEPQSREPVKVHLYGEPSGAVERWTWVYNKIPLVGGVGKMVSEALIVDFDAAGKVCHSKYTLIGVPTAELKARSAVPEMIDNAKAVSSGQPSPRWRSGLSAQAADLLVPAGDGIIVGTMQLSQKNIARAAEPAHGDLVYLDARTGQQRWHAPRRDLFGGGYSIVALSPVIVLCGREATGNASYEALDVATGARRWSVNAGPWHSSFVVPDSDLLILAEEAKNGGTEVRAVPLATGGIAWKQSLESVRSPRVKKKGEQSQGVPIQLFESGHKLVLISGGIEALDVASGARLWTAELPELTQAEPRALIAGDDLFVGAGFMAVRLDLRDGKPKWTTQCAGVVSLIASANDAVLAVTSKPEADAPPAFYIQAIDSKSGKERWSKPLPAAIHSALMVHQGIVYLTTSDRLLGLDLASGALRHEQKIDVPATDFDLPDFLLVRADRVVVVRQQGVAAFEPKSGKWLYSVTVEGGDAFRCVLTADTPMKMPGESVRETTKVAGAALTAAPQIPQAADYLQGAQFRENLILHSSLATPNMKLRAIDQYANEAKTMSSIALGGAAAVSAVNIGAAVVLAEREHEKEQVMRAKGEVNRVKWLQKWALHFTSISGNLYARPFMRPEGWGLKVVDLDTGHQGDLWLTPNATILPYLGLCVPQWTVVESQQMLLAVGTGLDPNMYQTYSWNSPQDVGTVLPGTYAVPFPAVLAFDKGGLPSGVILRH